MGILQDFIARWKERKHKSNELEEDVNIREKIIAKRKSSNERELEGYLEEQRQRDIKTQVEKWREQKKQEHWHSPTALATPNMFGMKSNRVMTRENVFLR